MTRRLRKMNKTIHVMEEGKGNNILIWKASVDCNGIFELRCGGDLVLLAWSDGECHVFTKELSDKGLKVKVSSVHGGV